MRGIRLMLTPSHDVGSIAAAMNNLRRALRYFRPDAPRLVLAVLLLVLATAANLLKPWPLAFLVDHVLDARPLPAGLARWLDPLSVPARVVALASVTFGLHLAQAVLGAWQNYLLIGAGLAGLARVRNAVFQHLQRLAPGYHQRVATGDLIYRATWDTYAFQTLFQQGLFGFVNAALSLALMVVVMGQLHLSLTLVALSTVPVLLLAMRVFGGRMGRQSLAAHAADSRVTSAVQQNIDALPLVQSCNREADEARRFEARVDEAHVARRAQHGWEVGYLAAIAIMFGLGTALILWLGAQAVLAGSLSIGALLVFVAYLGQFYEPLNQLSRVGTVLSDAGAGIRRVFEILDATEVVQEAPRARALIGQGSNGATSEADAVTVRGNLSFEGVTFAYRPGHPVLEDVSLALRAGESVALIGPSGAGKTTLIHLLLRFRDPTAGSIRLEGVDLRELKLTDLRARIALVFQEPVILPTTVAENIGYGRPEATVEEIRGAAAAAGAARFIDRLPQGLATPLGDGALRLSVGERQRLNLARAFLQDAPILLLDEPTSALDAESEALVAEGLANLMKGRTTLMIAHRAGSLRRPDRVVRLSGGRVTAVATPEELAATDPAFARAFGAWLE